MTNVHDPKEIWPTAENPRACLEGMFTHPTQEVPAVNLTVLQELRRLQALHAQAVRRALEAANVLVTDLKTRAGCLSDNCFPNCIPEGQRTTWNVARATIDAELELRQKIKDMGG